MTCSEARRRMLEADTVELEGDGESALAQHVRVCVTCRGAAADFLRAERTIRAAWSREAPRRSADDVADAVLYGVGDERVARAEAGRPTGLRRAAGVLAVAGLAATVVIGIGIAETRRATAPVAAPIAQAAPPATGVDVEVPEGRNAVVFNTRDTLITVVWIY